MDPERMYTSLASTSTYSLSPVVKARRKDLQIGVKLDISQM